MNVRQKRISSITLFILFTFFSLTFLSAGLWGALQSESREALSHQVPVISTKIKIDGRLDEAVWERALALDLNYEVEPGENISPPVRTRVYLAYSDRFLYVGFRAQDPDPRSIRARYTDRDNIDNDDHVGIVLDTFNDSRLAYVFMCNPYGIQADHITTPIGSRTEWDGIWHSAARITGNGYEVEIAVPFSSLRFQGGKSGQVWGIDAVRSYPRDLRHLVGLFPRDRDNNCYLCQASKVVGFGGTRPGLNLELDPTLSGVLSQERPNFPNGGRQTVNRGVEPGMTARWSFTPNLTLSAAVNPDFSNVEADAAQLDINRQFALFYPEKRPFFLEGLNIFRSVLYAVHTRTIADPTWGIKLTGKEGRHAVGFFSVQDRITNLMIPGPEISHMTSMDMRNMSTVFRYRWDMGRSSNLGFFITDREGGDYFNRVASVDGDLKFMGKHRVLFQYMGSQTRYPGEIAETYGQPAGKFQGHFLDTAYIYETENLSFYVLRQDAGPDFRADLGFVNQTGYMGYLGSGEYRWRRNPGHWYTALRAGGTYMHIADRNNNLLQEMVQGTFSYQGPLQSSVDVLVNLGKRTYLGREFDDNYLEFSAGIRPSGAILLQFSGGAGDSVDYTHVQAGQFLRLSPSVQYNLGKHLYLGLDHVYENLRVEGGRLYSANLSNLKMVYQFNARSFLRTILQYADFRYNTALYVEPQDGRFRHLFSQFLFSYKLNPQTVLFLGYSDDSYGYYAMPIRQSNRTFFLKIGYALVM